MTNAINIPEIKEVKQTGTITFTCPNCGQHEITRTKNERQIVKKFACPGCGFEGPN
jgi:predicted RNA-binding Zn-ribbon protein involved in translation (DUF1610 family)